MYKTHTGASLSTQIFLHIYLFYCCFLSQKPFSSHPFLITALLYYSNNPFSILSHTNIHGKHKRVNVKNTSRLKLITS